jgi:hypothetical protein
MAKADTWPVSAAETVLLAALSYVVLLIGLAVTRSGERVEPAQPPPIATLLQAGHPVAAVGGQAGGSQAAGGQAVATCVTTQTVPYAYATAPEAQRQRAFGPPVEPDRPLTVAKINGELWRRLCGGAAVPGGPVRGPDRRLFVAIDAVLNRRDPNRAISQAEWATGVERFISRDAIWANARVVRRTMPRGTATFAMQVRPRGDPLVLRTRLSAPKTGRYLLLPARTASGSVQTLTLRLQCGFQPVL